MVCQTLFDDESESQTRDVSVSTLECNQKYPLSVAKLFDLKFYGILSRLLKRKIQRPKKRSRRFSLTRSYVYFYLFIQSTWPETLDE